MSVFTGDRTAVAPAADLHRTTLGSSVALRSLFAPQRRAKAKTFITQDVSMTSPHWHIHTIYGRLDVGERVAAAAPHKSASTVPPRLLSASLYVVAPLWCLTPLSSDVSCKGNGITKQNLCFSSPSHASERTQTSDLSVELTYIQQISLIATIDDALRGLLLCACCGHKVLVSL